MITWLLFLVVCVYQALDVWQSWWLFHFGAGELNPLVALGIEGGGIMFVVYLKTLFTLLLLLGIIIQKRKEKEKKNGMGQD